MSETNILSEHQHMSLSLRHKFMPLMAAAVLLGLACLLVSACRGAALPEQIPGFKREFTTVVPGKYNDVIISDDGNKLMLLGAKQADTYTLAPDMVKESSTGIALADDIRFPRAPYCIFLESNLAPSAGFSREFGKYLNHYRNWRQYMRSDQSGNDRGMLAKFGENATPVMLGFGTEEPAVRASSKPAGMMKSESLDLRVRAYQKYRYEADENDLLFFKDSSLYRTYKMEELKLRHEDQVEDICLSATGKYAALILFYSTSSHALEFSDFLGPSAHACITLLDLEDNRICAKVPIPYDSHAHIRISFSEQSGKLVLFDWTSGELTVYSMPRN